MNEPEYPDITQYGDLDELRAALAEESKIDLIEEHIQWMAALNVLGRRMREAEEKLAWVHAYLEEQIGHSDTPDLPVWGLYNDLHELLRCCGYGES